MPLHSLRLTGEQIRAARALARIEQTELAQASGLSVETIKRLERIRGEVDAKGRTMDAILTAFAGFGVTFDVGEDGAVGICRAQGRAHGPPPAPVSARAAASPVGAGGAPLHRLIYASRVKASVADRMKPLLDNIALSARQNDALGVTGALFACEGAFLQALEGPKPAVQQIYGAISSDPRHEALRVIESRPVAARQFRDWTLCCGRFAADDEALAEEPALKDGFHPERLTVSGALGLLCIMRDLQAFPPRARRGPAGGACSLAAACRDTLCAASARRAADTRSEGLSS